MLCLPCPHTVVETPGDKKVCDSQLRGLQAAELAAQLAISVAELLPLAELNHGMAQVEQVGMPYH